MFKLRSYLQKNVFLKGSIVFSLSNFIIVFLNFIFHSISAKALGPSKYSELATLFSIIALFTLPLGILGNLIIQRLGYAGLEREAVADGIYTWALSYKKSLIILSAALIPLLFLFPKLFNISFEASLTLILLIVLSIYVAFFNALSQGLHLFYTFALGGIIGTLIKLSGAILAYFHFNSTISIYTALIVGFTIQGFFLSFKTLKHIASSSRKSSYKLEQKITRIISQRYVLISIFSLVAFIMLSNADVMLVKRLFNSFDAGIYSAWSLFAKLITYITAPLYAILFIFFSRAEQTHSKKYMYLSLILLTCASSLFYLLYSYFGSLLVLTIFNKDYLPVLAYIRQAAIFGYLYSIISALNYYFVARRSSVALILPYTIIIYIIGIGLMHESLDAVIQVSIGYGFWIACMYVLAFIKEKPTFSPS